MRNPLFITALVAGAFVNAVAGNTKQLKECRPGEYKSIRDTTKNANDTTAKDTVDNDPPVRTYEINLQGANDQSHYGLRNTKPLPYLLPGFTYYAKSGFYVGVSDQYLLIKQRSGFDVFGLNSGWDINFSDNTTLNLNYQFYHHRKNTPNYLLGGLTGILETYFDQYIIGQLEGRLTIDYDIYKKYANQPKTPNDLVFTPDLLYTFEWDFGKKSSLSFIPEANIDIGTRNMYTIARNAAQNDSVTYLKYNKANYTITGNNSFGALDYNLILSIEYAVGKFSLEPALTYTSPLYNETNLSLTKSSPFVSASVTLAYDIKSKK